MNTRYTVKEIIAEANARGWKQGVNYELPDLLNWVNNHSKLSLDDILDRFESEPCY